VDLAPELQAFAAGFPVTLAHLAISFLLLVAGAFLYAKLTPYREIAAIREGNAAAAVSYSGVIVGLALPLAASMHSSTSTVEVAVWGVATVAVQLLVFRLLDFLLSGLPQRAQDGEVSAAVLLVAAKLGGAILLTAAVAG
jgi:putative membrane protein